MKPKHTTEKTVSLIQRISEMAALVKLETLIIFESSNPMLLDIEGDRYLTFNNCTNSGGGSLEGKVTAKITGLFNIILNNCWFDGIWDINVASSLDGITSTIDRKTVKTPF